MRGLYQYQIRNHNELQQIEVDRSNPLLSIQSILSPHL